EVDVDALCDEEDVFVAGVMEHIEQAGVHSGDSYAVIPPFTLKQDVIREIDLKKGIMVVRLLEGL
ncbi:MAG: hypothetical protein NTY16_03220, partial [Deltaproteobacteria bacterium]|nr:hypothetical protein [Deltaproteobacteria bacterium]